MSYQRSRTKYHPLLAGYDVHGRPWVHPEVVKRRGQDVADRIMVHQETFLEKVSELGVSWSVARAKALKAEHKGMSREEVQEYEGSLGALENDLKRNPPKVDPIELDIVDEGEAGPNYRVQADQLEKEGKVEAARKLREIASDEDKHKEILEKLHR